MELDWGTEDMEYLQKVELHSEGALNEVRPDVIIYNAGTDILDGDPLGGLAISPQVQLSLILPFNPHIRSQMHCLNRHTPLAGFSSLANKLLYQINYSGLLYRMNMQ